MFELFAIIHNIEKFQVRRFIQFQEIVNPVPGNGILKKKKRFKSFTFHARKNRSVGTFKFFHGEFQAPKNYILAQIKLSGGFKGIIRIQKTKEKAREENAGKVRRASRRIVRFDIIRTVIN